MYRRLSCTEFIDFLKYFKIIRGTREKSFRKKITWKKIPKKKQVCEKAFFVEETPEKTTEGTPILKYRLIPYHDLTNTNQTTRNARPGTYFREKIFSGI